MALLLCCYLLDYYTTRECVRNLILSVAVQKGAGTGGPPPRQRISRFLEHWPPRLELVAPLPTPPLPPTSPTPITSSRLIQECGKIRVLRAVMCLVQTRCRCQPLHSACPAEDWAMVSQRVVKKMFVLQPAEAVGVVESALT